DSARQSRIKGQLRIKTMPPAAAVVGQLSSPPDRATTCAARINELVRARLGSLASRGVHPNKSKRRDSFSFIGRLSSAGKGDAAAFSPSDCTPAGGCV